MLFQLFLVIIFFIGTDYGDAHVEATTNSTGTPTAEVGADDDIGSYYWYFNHVVIMMPIGFGYLVTFLRKYRYSGVGYTYLLTALIFQWSLIVLVFWQKVRVEAHKSARLDCLSPSHDL